MCGDDGPMITAQQTRNFSFLPSDGTTVLVEVRPRERTERTCAADSTQDRARRSHFFAASLSLKRAPRRTPSMP